MQCRIEVLTKEKRRIVYLSGRLREPQVPEFLFACADGGASVTVDLTDLLSADLAGLDALSTIEAQGARFVGTPEYLRRKLDVRAHERWLRSHAVQH